MPSNLRLQIDIQSTQSFYPRPISSSPSSPKQKMSLTQTYRIASSARGKLGMEASRPDHNLRVLVGHANLLDNLMIELASAEREQEAWFNSTIRNSTLTRNEAPKHIQWFDSIAQEAQDEIYEDDSSSDSDSEYDEDTYEVETQAPAIPPRRRSVSPPPPTSMDFAYDDESDDEEYMDADSDSEELALQRVPSHTPPELMHDSDSEDETSTPPSPLQQSMPFTDQSLDGRPMTKTPQTSLVPQIVVEELLNTSSSIPLIAAY